MNTQRKIKVWCFASLDALTARADGDIDFITDYPNPARHDYGLPQFLDGIGCALMTRMQYVHLQSCEVWPVGGMPCHVLTDRRFTTVPGQDIRYMRPNMESNDPVIDLVQELQAGPGKDIWLVGDHELLALLKNRGMIDEITINIIPKIVGNGMPLFPPGGTESDWTPTKCHQFDNGVIQMRFCMSGVEF